MYTLDYAAFGFPVAGLDVVLRRSRVVDVAYGRRGAETLKQVIGCAVFLHDDHYMLDFAWGGGGITASQSRNRGGH